MNKELQLIYDDLINKWMIIKISSDSWDYEKVLNKYWTYSNLNLYCSLFVRTKFFIEWFWDWQNNLEQSSKIIDEFWEPKLVWHGTNKKFEKFSDNNEWIYFCDFEIANRYAITKFDLNSWFLTEKNGIYVYWAFLNVRNPLYTNKIKYWDIDKETNWKNKDNDWIIMYKTRDSLWTYDQYLTKNTNSIMIIYGQ